MEGNRLAEVLVHIIQTTKDTKLKRTLELVVTLDDVISRLDWNDWENYKCSESFGAEMREWFKEVEEA